MAATRWTYLGLALLAVGFLAAGTGGATHLHEQQCQAVQFVEVTNASAANVSTAGYDAVPYATLSGPEKRVFRSALADDGQVLTRRGVIEAGVVEYRNSTYVVQTSTDGGCTPWHPTRVVVPLGGGLGLVLLGVALTRGRGPNP